MKNSFLLTVLAVFMGLQLNAQQPEIFSKNSLAINGYDPVAYFTEGKPVKGNDSLNIEWNLAKWIFSTRANLDSFNVNPEKYAPQFGGYCAYGMSRGYKAPTDGGAWSIVDGKLYLNYNEEAKQIWNKDQEQAITKAHANWKGIKHAKRE